MRAASAQEIKGLMRPPDGEEIGLQLSLKDSKSIPVNPNRDHESLFLPGANKKQIKNKVRKVLNQEPIQIVDQLP